MYLSTLSEKPQTSLCSITTVSVSYADTFGMIQQERQNNIINILEVILMPCKTKASPEEMLDQIASYLYQGVTITLCS